MPRLAGPEPKLQPIEKKNLQGRAEIFRRHGPLAGSRGTFQKSVWPVNRAQVRAGQVRLRTAGGAGASHGTPTALAQCFRRIRRARMSACKQLLLLVMMNDYLQLLVVLGVYRVSLSRS